MKQTSIVPFLAVAAAATLCAFAPRTAAAGPPRPPAKSESDKKPAPQVPASQVPASAEEFRMSPGDKLRIEVYKDPQLSQSVQVRPDGKVTLPLIGDIEANGRTPIELRDAIARSLKEYVTNPTVTVIVVEATTATAYV